MERGGISGAGFPVLAGGLERLTEPVECLGFAGPLAGTAEQRQCLLMVVRCLLILAPLLLCDP
jgi:hypothetical protein